MSEMAWGGVQWLGWGDWAGHAALNRLHAITRTYFWPKSFSSLKQLLGSDNYLRTQTAVAAADGGRSGHWPSDFNGPRDRHA